MERDSIFARLRSFDHAGLDDGAFERQALGLLAGDCADAADVHRRFLARPRRLQQTELADADLREAADCLGNVFVFHGEPHGVGEAIDWDRNPGTDHWVHDLNRFAYLDILVRATLATGDEKYARKGAALVLDWVEKNPVTRSWFWDWEPGTPKRKADDKAWASYLNIAIHLRRWAELFEELVRFWTPLELLHVLKSIHDQLGYLELVIPTATNNWIVIGAAGMMITAVRLPELRDRQRFIDYAWQKVLTEADRQVLPDGVQFELTPGYHGVVERLFLDVMAVCREAGIDVPETMETVTARMLDYTMQTITPDGLQVAFNDSDPGAGVASCARLTREGLRRSRQDWVYVGTRGREGTPPAVRSQAFEYGGIYVMRTGWGPGDTFLAFDGGPWGYSHQHDDRLGFWLSALGRSFLIDPGRYLYDDNNPFSRRKYLNTTRAHSTITVDGEGQADRHFPQMHEPRKKLTENTWTVEGAFQRVAGSHTLGYGDGGRIQVVHRRSLTFWAPDVVLVLDHVTGDGEHCICSRLQFHPGTVESTAGVWHTTYPDANLAVLPVMDAVFDAFVVEGQLNPAAGWYSHRVNHIEPSPTLSVQATTTLPLRAGFLIVPFTGDEPPDLAIAFDGDAVGLRVNRRERRVSFEEVMR